MVRSILMPTKPPPWGRKTTHTKSELKPNAATGNSSHKQDTRQLVTCEFQSSTSKPDKEVHFRYSQRPQTQNSAKVRGTINPSIKFGAKLTGQQHPKKTQRAAITSYPNPHHPLQGWDQEMSTGEAHTHQKRTKIQCHNG